MDCNKGEMSVSCVRKCCMKCNMLHISGGGGGGGGTSILTVSGTGYDFPVITIDTGYLNRPNWLLAGYSIYHRVASQPGSQPTMFMSGPRSRHQRRCVRDATDFYECMTIHSRIESPSVPVPTNLESMLDRETLSPSHRVCKWKFLVRYIVTGCIFCAPSSLRQGQVFTPPPPQRHIPVTVLWRCPPGHIFSDILHTFVQCKSDQ